jgi:1,4-alpha-glucan branching enzyme
MRRIEMNRFLAILILIFSAIIAESSYAQSVDVLRMEEGKLILRISTKLKQKELDSILRNMNMMQLSVDSLKSKQLNTVYQADGWRVFKQGKEFVEICKDVEAIHHKYEYINSISFVSDSVFNGEYNDTFNPYAEFGYNTFNKKNTVVKLSNGLTRFVFYQKLNAKNVYLSGSFNSWAIKDLEMEYTDTAWYCDIKLKPGKHLYKFIIDGEWMSDPENKQKERDTYNGYNSVYFECNHQFKLEGYAKARKVIVSGSFNNWDERDLQMQKLADVWVLNVYLKDGSYAYKFIVDRNWITDPASKDDRDDGSGNINSFFSIGKATLFELKAFPYAKNIYLAGNFNDWRTNEIALKKDSTNTWKCSYVLAPGNYQYKFLVDNAWVLDPSNEVMIGEFENANSIVSVNPNYTFRLKGYNNAKDVRISGNFMDWPNPGIRMKKEKDEWYVQLYLPVGKHLYKFIVDGVWILDPANPLFEQNEHNTGNSFIWMENR